MRIVAVASASARWMCRASLYRCSYRVRICSALRTSGSSRTTRLSGPRLEKRRSSASRMPRSSRPDAAAARSSSSAIYLLDWSVRADMTTGTAPRLAGDAPCSRSARRLPHADHRLGGVGEGRRRRAPRRRSDRDRCRSSGIVAFTIIERAATELKACISGGEARDDTSLDGLDRILVDDAPRNNQVEFRWKVARGRGQAADRLRELHSCGTRMPWSTQAVADGPPPGTPVPGCGLARGVADSPRSGTRVEVLWAARSPGVARCPQRSQVLAVGVLLDQPT